MTDLRSHCRVRNQRGTEENGLLAANERIYDLMRQRPDALGMGTTIVGAAINPQSFIHFNVGDSRIYRHSAGNLTRLSHDDVSDAVANPFQRSSHLITQSLGGHPSKRRIAPHVATAPSSSGGEALLLCSDGLTDMVNEEDILRVIENMPDAEACARALFEFSLHAGGRDNISVIVARVA